MQISEVLTIKDIGFFSKEAQIFLICALFVITVFQQYREFKDTGKLWGTKYPVNTFLMFCPIYEEIIFRGLILSFFVNNYSITYAVIFSSLLFGLFHFKNIFYLPKKELTYQILYTGIILGPILALSTIYTGNIWLAVMLHYFNNLFAGKVLSKI